MRWRTPRSPIPLGPLPLQSLAAAAAAAAGIPCDVVSIHQQLVVIGLLPSPSSDPYLATKLLHVYSLSADLPSTLHLFSLLPDPNAFAFTSILTALSRSSSAPHQTLFYYSLMRSSSIPPDAYSLPPAIRSHPPAATALHAEAIKFSAAASPHVSKALVSAYARLRDPVSARRAFHDSRPPHDLLAWNSLIAAYAAAGDADASRELLTPMRSDGCEPDIVTWNTLIDGYCRAERFDEALQVFEGILHPNVVSWTTIIVGYANCGNHEAALGLFRRMMAVADVPPDHDTLSSVLSSCRHVAALFSGREVHAYGLKTTAIPSAFYCSAGSALVTMYARCGKMSAAKSVFHLMDPADVVTWNAVILAFTLSGMSTTALEYFTEMQSRGIGCDQTTVATVLPTCDLVPGKQIHAHVIRTYYQIATHVSNALISMYSRCGEISAAHAVFTTMTDPRDVVSWNAMIGGFGSHGLAERALSTMEQMGWFGVRPNLITLTNVLTACSHRGLIDEGLELFERIKRVYGLAPTMEQWACVVDMLARAGRFREAAGLAGRMPGAGAWGAVLAACRAHQNVEFGRMAFDELVRLEPDNAGNYVTTANIYARAGRWEEAKSVRMMMEGRGLVKPSGYSWIEVAKE